MLTVAQCVVAAVMFGGPMRLAQAKNRAGSATPPAPNVRTKQSDKQGDVWVEQDAVLSCGSFKCRVRDSSRYSLLFTWWLRHGIFIVRLVGNTHGGHARIRSTSDHHHDSISERRATLQCCP
jgi:hypothetical protein